jgi:hypothetical protein
MTRPPADDVFDLQVAGLVAPIRDRRFLGGIRSLVILGAAVHSVPPLAVNVERSSLVADIVAFDEPKRLLRSDFLEAVPSSPLESAHAS